MYDSKKFMELKINGEINSFTSSLSLSQLFKELKIANIGFAVAINREVIPHSQYENTVLKEGDEVEIVQAVGGG